MVKQRGEIQSLIRKQDFFLYFFIMGQLKSNATYETTLHWGKHFVTSTHFCIAFMDFLAHVTK